MYLFIACTGRDGGGGGGGGGVDGMQMVEEWKDWKTGRLEELREERVGLQWVDVCMREYDGRVPLLYGVEC